MSTLPFEIRHTDLQHAHAMGHLESCDFCLAQEALTFAELLEYSRADVPVIDYFTDYYSVDRISAARVEAIRECILGLCKPALCKPAPVCRGCGEAIDGGPYCAGCAEQVQSLIVERSFELPQWAKRLGAGVGYVVVFLLFVFDLSAILAMWPGGMP